MQQGGPRLLTGFRSIWARVALALLALAVVGVPPARPVAAGEDVCPEPNDQFQVACYLGGDSDALGFISRADDVDAYRIEVLDFGVTLRAEIADMPFPYRLHLADWRGQVIGESADEGGRQVISAKLGPPGSYYLFVDSRFGQFSDGAPYRVLRELTYAVGVPAVMYSTEFRRPGDAEEFTGTNEWGNYYTEGGRYHIDMRQGGTGNAAALAWAFWGPVYEDFTFVTDARVTTPGPEGGYFLSFRRRGDFDAYFLLVNLARRELKVWRFIDGQQALMVPDTPVPNLNPAPDVNRIAIRSVGSDHRININGTEVAHFEDGELTDGRLGLGALTLTDPVNVVYDNIIVTKPL